MRKYGKLNREYIKRNENDNPRDFFLDFATQSAGDLEDFII